MPAWLKAMKADGLSRTLTPPAIAMSQSPSRIERTARWRATEGWSRPYPPARSGLGG